MLGVNYVHFSMVEYLGLNLGEKNIPSVVRKHGLQSITLAMWKNSRDHWPCESDGTFLLLYVNWFYIDQLSFSKAYILNPYGSSTTRRGTIST